MSTMPVGSRVLVHLATTLGEYVSSVNFCSCTHSASLMALVTNERIVIFELKVDEVEDQNGKLTTEYDVVERHSLKRSSYGGKCFVDLAWDFETSSVEMPHAAGDSLGETPVVLYVADGCLLVSLSFDLSSVSASEKCEVISNHSGSTVLSLASSSTSEQTCLATVATDNFLRLWTIEPGSRGVGARLDFKINLGTVPRAVSLHRNLRNIVMVTGIDGVVKFFDVKADRCVEEVDMSRGLGSDVVVNGAEWHPSLPSTFVLATNHRALFNGKDSRDAIDYPISEAKWCPSNPRYLAVLGDNKSQLLLYDGNTMVKNLGASGLFSSISWHGYLPVFVCGVGHDIHVYRFGS